MGIRHSKIATQPDNDNGAEVQPSDWNEEHEADGAIGKLLDLAVIPDRIPYIDAFGEGSLLPIVTPAKSFLAGPTTTEMRAAIGAIGTHDPIFTGNPRAPTPDIADNDTSIATTEFVVNKINALIAASPGLLDTLDEIAAAIGDDPNFAATMTSALGLRVRVDAPQGLTTPQKDQAIANMGLGTTAKLNVGVLANQVVQLDGTAKLPAVDGSQLTNLPSGAAGAGYGGTSVTTLTPTTGSRVFATQTGLAYQVGSRMRATSAGNTAVWMEGIVTAYAAGSLTLNVDAIGTPTSRSDWAFSVSGLKGADAAPINGTSTTSTTPSLAVKVFTTQAGLAFQVGTRVRVASQSAAAVWMEGKVTAYVTTSLTVDVDLIGTATAKTDWTILICGERGAQGAQGIQGVAGNQGIQGVQGPAGSFPVGGGVIGSFACGTSGPVDAGGSSYGGSWVQVSRLGGEGGFSTGFLWQRYA